MMQETATWHLHMCLSAAGNAAGGDDDDKQQTLEEVGRVLWIEGRAREGSATVGERHATALEEAGRVVTCVHCADLGSAPEL